MPAVEKTDFEMRDGKNGLVGFTNQEGHVSSHEDDEDKARKAFEVLRDDDPRARLFKRTIYYVDHEDISNKRTK